MLPRFQEDNSRMEADSLEAFIDALRKVQPLGTLNQTTYGIFPTEIPIILHTKRQPSISITLTGLAPFHTVEDLHRAVWLKQGKPNELFPYYTFLGMELPDGSFRGATTKFSIPLPNPEEAVVRPEGITAVTDTAGNRLPIQQTAQGGLLLEELFEAYAREFDLPAETIPTLHCFSYDYLMSRFTGVKPISAPEWNRRLWPYFPALDQTTTGLPTVNELKVGKLMEKLLTKKIQQSEELEVFAGTGLSELEVSAVRLLSLQWPKPPQEVLDTPDVDELFFSAPVTEARPFMRLVMPKQTPLTKLYQKTRLELPKIHDPKLLRRWSEEKPPNADDTMMFAKVELPRVYATLRVSEDRSADLIIQPPVGQKTISMETDLGGDEFAANIEAGIQGIIPEGSEVKLGSANLTLQYKFKGVIPKLIRNSVKKFLLTNSTLFQETVPLEEDKGRYFVTLRYKGVNNFTTPTTIETYLTYVYYNKGVTTEEQLRNLKNDLAEQFDITPDQAIDYIEEFLLKTTKVEAVDEKGEEFVPSFNPGVDIGIQSNVGDTFLIQLFNVRSVHLLDIQRIVTILLYAFENYKQTSDKAVEEAAVEAAEDNVEARTVEEVEELRTNASQRRVEFELADLPSNDEGAEAPAVVVEKKQTKVEETETKLIADSWYIRQLMKLDPILFNIGKDKDNYGRKCQEHDGRQPVGLDFYQFTRMINVYVNTTDYKRKPNIKFIVYKVTEPDSKVGRVEIRSDTKNRDFPTEITVTQYGSDPTEAKMSYFLCPEYFCLRDMLPLIPDDYEASQDYYGDAKPENSCPFCQGTEIKNVRKPELGETVLKRKEKGGDKKVHKYIGFLSKFAHPSKGLGLPCCFLSNKSIGTTGTDPFFKHIRDKILTAKATATSTEVPKETISDVHKGVFDMRKIVSGLTKIDVSKEYIIGPEKWPLDLGKIGLPNLGLDEFFGQDSTKFVARSAIKQELKPTVNGLFRFGTFNRPQYSSQSLFGALCPILGESTPEAVAKKFETEIDEQRFSQLNFGNLVLEFFEPSQLTEVQLKATDKFEQFRIKASYLNFKAYLRDTTKPKLLRHFYHALLEIFKLTIVPIQYLDDPRVLATKVDVSCPLIGYDSQRYAKNKVAFLTYSGSNIWEPLLYVYATETRPTLRIESKFVFEQKRGTTPTQTDDFFDPRMPPMIKSRYDEFITECRSAFRGAFTYQEKIESRYLDLVSTLKDLDAPAFAFRRYVRDSYNHLIAITVSLRKGGRGEVLIPVVDDGRVIREKDYSVHYTIDSIEKAPYTDVLKVYAALKKAMSPFNTLYTVKELLVNSKNQVIAYVLADDSVDVALIMPCEPAPLGETGGLLVRKLKEDTFEFEYQLNRKLQLLVKPSVARPQSKYQIFVDERDKANEIYEHLRVTFANYIATQTDSTLRTYIESVIRDKRKLSIGKIDELVKRFGSTILQWFLRNEKDVQYKEVLVRRDCTKLSESTCTQGSSVCSWDDDNKKCKIHTNPTVRVRSESKTVQRMYEGAKVGYTLPEKVDAMEYFVTRLFDEIVRLPARSIELLEDRTRKVRIPSTNIHVGTQWILPENVPAWYDLLRSDTMKDGSERPQYYEEFSSKDERPEEEDREFALQQIYSLDNQIIPESILSMIAKEYRSRLAIKIVGEAEDDRKTPIFYALNLDLNFDDFDLYGSSFTPDELQILSSALEIPVIQVTQTSSQPIGVSPSTSIRYTKTRLPSLAIVLFPDLPTGPGILYDILDKELVVPSQFIEGQLLNSLLLPTGRSIRSPQKPPTPTAVATPAPPPKEPEDEFEDADMDFTNEDLPELEEETVAPSTWLRRSAKTTA
jgi:hypothetical protein